MAIQPPHKKQPGMQILRTPAPDVVTSIRATSGQSGYGQSASPIGNSKATLPPGTGGPQSLLGKNLLESVDDPAFQQVLKGLGRGDEIPAEVADEYRAVSDKSYAPSWGMKRNQDPSILGKAKKPV